MSPNFTSACKTCANFETNAKDYVANDQRYDHPPVTVQEVSSHGPAKPGPSQIVDVAFTQAAARVVDKAGKTIKEVTTAKGVSVVDLTWIEGRWMITSIKVAQ